MSYESIGKLIGKLSCDFVLADAQEPETLLCLLPVLESVHGKCIELSLDDLAEDILKAKDIINIILNNDSVDVDKDMNMLDELISGLSVRAGAVKQCDDSELCMVKTNLDRFSELVGRFCPGEIMDLGAMIGIMEELIEASKGKEFIILHEVCIACRNYIENMTLRGLNNTKPIEEAIILLKSIFRHIKKQEAFVFDYSDVLELLNVRFDGDHGAADADTKRKDSESSLSESEFFEEVLQEEITLRKISDEDMEILMDFISEAMENLDTIEVNLIELENDPHDKDIINDIFRPFHTIKGVSGFLSLTKINKLAHATEDFLDSARNRDFLINDTATDVILESVDILKRLIARVKEGTDTGFMPADDDIDIESLQNRLHTLQIDLTEAYKKPIGEILVEKGAVAKESIEQALEVQKKCPERKIGEILVAERKATSGQVASALLEQNPAKRHMSTQVKVSTEKLDDLVNYAGELVIAQSMLRQKTAHDQALSQSVAQLGQIVTKMQNVAMSMRMIPIKATFMKMIRLVRDLSRKSGKDVVLKMEGEDTEIDRNVVDALYEPMVHMIRNSIDHGIEEKSVRLENGKSATGRVVLRAYHKGGHIVIEIEDDGKGLDRDTILEKAKSTGLVSGDEKMTDAQVYDLILQPGFSTAQKITDVSGRGVGMDVVKDGVEKFKGQLEIQSTKGKGTRFTISLPLTLAIIDGMLVKVDSERYVVPTIAIEKVFKPERKDYFTVEEKGEMIVDRGRFIPLIRLNEIYRTSDVRKIVENCLVVIIEAKGEKKALLIDELLGKDEYVIKSLGAGLGNVDGLAGGAILADGQVGLILDIHGIINLVSRLN